MLNVHWHVLQVSHGYTNLMVSNKTFAEWEMKDVELNKNKYYRIKLLLTLRGKI